MAGPEGERQARIELARLDGVGGPPGHIESVGQLGLRPVALGAQRRNGYGVGRIRGTPAVPNGRSL
jgi:hypothetical protein